MRDRRASWGKTWGSMSLFRLLSPGHWVLIAANRILRRRSGKRGNRTSGLTSPVRLIEGHPLLASLSY
jgi:hypothetical protein